MNKRSENPTIKYEYIPPIELRRFVQTLLLEDVRGNKTEAERRTGVQKQRFYYYFETRPEFRKWFSEQCDKFLASYEALTVSALKNKILEGDVQAIRTYYELVKKIRHTFEHSGNINIGETKIIIIKDTDKIPTITEEVMPFARKEDNLQIN